MTHADQSLHGHLPEGQSPDGLILERALLGAIAGMVPVPFVDDMLVRRSRRTLVGELAARAGLRLDKASVKVLADDPQRSLLANAGLGIVARVLRSVTMPLRIAERARGALLTFQLATLLDEYARRQHSGIDLDVERTRRVRATMDEAIRLTPVSLDALRSPSAHGQALRTRFAELWSKQALT